MRIRAKLSLSQNLNLNAVTETTIFVFLDFNNSVHYNYCNLVAYQTSEFVEQPKYT